MAKPLNPPTDAEFDRALRRFERWQHIPYRLKDIERWVEAIQAAPADVRNTPDVQPKKDGGTFVSGVTDLDHLLEHAAAVRRKFKAGKFLLANASLRGLEERIRAVNARVTAPLIERGKKELADSRRGASQKMALNTAPDHDARRLVFEKFRALGCSKMEAYKRAADKLGVSHRSISKAVTGR